MHDPQQAKTRRQLLVTALAAVATAVVSTASAEGATVDAATGNAPVPERATPAVAIRALDDLGVELMAVRLTASDFMIDLRYRVKDIARAQALLEQKVKPVLVNEATGDRFYIPQAPKVGALKQSATAKQPAIVDRTYFMLFANPDRKLKSGEKVTLYAGESVVKDIVVR
jgi:hypothetical protein